MDSPNPETDPERAIEDLPRGAVKDSIRVFAGWLKENRELLQAQITNLAIRFEEIDRENKRRLDEIVDQTRRTNGRVTDLEQTRQLDHALADGHQEWETRREQTDREHDERTAHAREKLHDRLASAGYIFLGVIAGAVGHKIGLA